MISDLFLTFANAQFRKEPEYLNSFLEMIQVINEEAYWQIANYSKEEFDQTYSLDADGHLLPYDSSKNLCFDDISDYAESEIETFFDYGIHEIFRKVIDLLKSHQSVFNTPHGCYNIAHEGVHRNDCKSCMLNEVGERRHIYKKCCNCVECNQIYFREILDIISEEVKKAENDESYKIDLCNMGCFDSLLERMNEVIRYKTVIKKASRVESILGCVEPVSWISTSLFQEDHQLKGHQFSRFVFGCVGYSLITFLKELYSTREKDEPYINIKRIKKCKICKEFFITSRIAKNEWKCSNCRGKRTKAEQKKSTEKESERLPTRIAKQEQQNENKIKKDAEKLWRTGNYKTKEECLRAARRQHGENYS